MSTVKPIDPEAFYKVSEIAKRLATHNTTITGYIRDGKINATNISKNTKKKNWRVKWVDLLKFIEENGNTKN